MVKSEGIFWELLRGHLNCNTFRRLLLRGLCSDENWQDSTMGWFKPSPWAFPGTDEGLGSKSLLEFPKRTCNFISATSKSSLYSRENRKKKQTNKFLT